MPGETLLGEFARWTPDAALVNHHPDDPNEPFDDAFDGRAEDRECGNWSDMNQKVIGDFEAWVDSKLELEAANVSLSDYYRGIGAQDFVTLGSLSERDPDDDAEGSILPAFRPILTLPPKDYTRGMEVAIDVEQVSAGSCARLPCSRGKRFKR